MYVLECRDGTYYTGHTNDLAGRVEAHNGGRGARYTRGRGPLRLVWFVECSTRGEAMRVEREVKKLSRREKERLVKRERSL